MENEINKQEVTPTVIAVPAVIPTPVSKPTMEEDLAALKQEAVALRVLLGKINKSLNELKEDTEMLVSIEYQRLLPSWKNKFIDFLVAVFHTQPQEEERESRRKTL